ncbi:MAG: hypothetical protein C0392_04370 [Syntrophus sp. (in: bacteria)]|nr:hypothetical protein [Syntrophus sp. (in: bacteria)]
MNRRLLITVCAILITAVTLCAEETRAQENTDETIAYLLGLVAKSDSAFIRNGQSYPGSKATIHMKNKYKHFKNQIKTPEDFIRLAATESLLSGEPYMVKTKEGQELRCDEWMKKALKEYRDASKNKRTEKKGP